MFQGVLHLNILKFRPVFSPEGTAGGCDENLLNSTPVFPVKGLENGAVLAVHRKDLNTHPLCQRHDDMARRHQRFLICQGDVFSGFDGLDRGKNTYHSHNGRHQDIRLGQRGNLDETVHSCHDADIHIF